MDAAELCETSCLTYRRRGIARHRVPMHTKVSTTHACGISRSQRLGRHYSRHHLHLHSMHLTTSLPNPQHTTCVRRRTTPSLWHHTLGVARTLPSSTLLAASRKYAFSHDARYSTWHSDCTGFSGADHDDAETTAGVQPQC